MDLEHFAQICSRWLALGVINLRLRRVFKKSGIFYPWLRCRSVVDVYPLHRNALPWPKYSRSTGYTFSQTALDFFHLHMHFHAAVAVTVVAAHHRRHIIVVPANSDFHIALVCKRVVGGIKTDPPRSRQIDLAPRV